MMTIPAFHLNGQPIDLGDGDPTESLLRWLKRQRLTGTKEGCADGDCGACTVAMVESDDAGHRHYRAVNSCLLPMGAVVGRDIVTVEMLADGETLHPVQQALVEHSGSQCGYCTPGFVMSLFAGYYAGELDDHSTEGNLCRCTGYAPIRRATAGLALLQPNNDRFVEVLGAERDVEPVAFDGFFTPLTIDAALALKQANPQAEWIAGATDLGVALSHGRNLQTVYIALDRIDELKQVSTADGHIEIGAGVTLSALESQLAGRIPALDQMLRWFAARQVRNRATFGGNLGTASPIGDLLPLLLALDGEINLRGPDGPRTVAAADYFVDYRKTVRQEHELVVSVRIPDCRHRTASYKVAKRQSDDISIVAAVFALGMDAELKITHARLAYGGVAAVPLRATAAEQFLLGRSLDAETMTQVGKLLGDAFTPLSDHRADAAYRRALCAGLFAKFLTEHFAPEMAA